MLWHRSGLVAPSLLLVAGCGGVTGVLPAASTVPTSFPTQTALHRPTRATDGIVGPLAPGAQPCFADRFPCDVISFSLDRERAIEVTVTWEGHPRALIVQLYWEGRWLAHEDVAPQTAPSHISFVRPRMEASSYELRVVSLEPTLAIPYRLILRY